MIPSARVLDCLVKNVTVIGIMGNIHGVNRANNPPPNPAQNVHHKVFGFWGAVGLFSFGSMVWPVPLSLGAACTLLVS